MIASNLGLLGIAALAQNTQTPPPAPAEASAAAPQATQGPGFQVPGTTTTSGTLAPSGPAGATGGSGGAGGGPGGMGLLLPLAGVMVLMLVMTSMTGRKERKKREAMLGAIKRGDRVQTTGGVIGTITDMSDQEMTLRVDETSNTRIRFARSSVQAVLKEGKDGGRGEVEAKPKASATTAT